MTLIARIQGLMLSDDTDDSARLAHDYKHAKPEAQAAMDAALICICGYSLETLLTYCRCGKCGHECAKIDLDEAVGGTVRDGEYAGKCPECGERSYMLWPEDDE